MAERASRCASTRASPRSGGSGSRLRQLRATAMTEPVEPLVADLLEWIGRTDGRPYAEVMDAWRTSCPRLPVWEEANARGFVDRRHRSGEPAVVAVSARGRA